MGNGSVNDALNGAAVTSHHTMDHVSITHIILLDITHSIVIINIVSIILLTLLQSSPTVADISHSSLTLPASPLTPRHQLVTEIQWHCAEQLPRQI